jgi:hypothetical protein
MTATQNVLALQQLRQEQLRAPTIGAASFQSSPIAPFGGFCSMGGVPFFFSGVQDPAIRRILLSQMLSTSNQLSTLALTGGLPMAGLSQLQAMSQNPVNGLRQQQTFQHLPSQPLAASLKAASEQASTGGKAEAIPTSDLRSAQAPPQSGRDPTIRGKGDEGGVASEAGFRLRRDSTRGGRALSLYVPSDDESLSQFQCLARKHIELFEAQEEDVEAGAQGRNKPIVMGQVGIRCIHCKVLPPNMRARAAVYYPSKLSVLYQAAQNIVNSHLPELCDGVPDNVRAELLSLGKKKSAVGGGKNYWSDAAEILGVQNTGDQGLRFRDDCEVGVKWGWIELLVFGISPVP